MPVAPGLLADVLVAATPVLGVDHYDLVPGWASLAMFAPAEYHRGLQALAKQGSGESALVAIAVALEVDRLADIAEAIR